MKTPVLMISAMMLVGASPLAPAVDSNSNVETVTEQTVDYRGKPPFRRSRAELPVTDVARLDVTPVRGGAKFRGRPPFNRRAPASPSVDVARLDVLPDAADKPRYRSRFAGRTQGARYRAE